MPINGVHDSDSVIQSYCHTVILLYGHTVKLSHRRTVTLSNCHTEKLSSVFPLKAVNYTILSPVIGNGADTEYAEK